LSWTAYAQEMLPAIQFLYQQTGLPAWLTLAMAAHEELTLSGHVASDSTFVSDNNPWGVRCHTSSYPCSPDDFQVYPSLMAAAQDLINALGPQRLQYAADPAAFMNNLQATGWDGPPPESDGYADSVLYTYGPMAKQALRAIGVDPTTGATVTQTGTGQGNEATSESIASSAIAISGAAALLFGAAVAAIALGTWEIAQAER